MQDGLSIASERAGQPQARQPTFAELFTPKLVTVLREGYGFADLRADADRRADGRHRRAAAVDGDRHRLGRDAGPRALHRDHRRLHHFALGGSRFQIGGPAGAFIVLVAPTVERHGVDGLSSRP